MLSGEEDFIVTEPRITKTAENDFWDFSFLDRIGSVDWEWCAGDVTLLIYIVSKVGGWGEAYDTFEL